MTFAFLNISEDIFLVFTKLFDDEISFFVSILSCFFQNKVAITRENRYQAKFIINNVVDICSRRHKLSFKAAGCALR